MHGNTSDTFILKLLQTSDTGGSDTANIVSILCEHFANIPANFDMIYIIRKLVHVQLYIFRKNKLKNTTLPNSISHTKATRKSIIPFHLKRMVRVYQYITIRTSIIGTNLLNSTIYVVTFAVHSPCIICK